MLCRKHASDSIESLFAFLPLRVLASVCLARVHSFAVGLTTASLLLAVGAQLASELGLSMTQFDPPSSSCPGYERIELSSTSTSTQKCLSTTPASGVTML